MSFEDIKQELLQICWDTTLVTALKRNWTFFHTVTEFLKSQNLDLNSGLLDKLELLNKLKLVRVPKMDRPTRYMSGLLVFYVPGLMDEIARIVLFSLFILSAVFIFTSALFDTFYKKKESKTTIQYWRDLFNNLHPPISITSVSFDQTRMLVFYNGRRYTLSEIEKINTEWDLAVLEYRDRVPLHLRLWNTVVEFGSSNYTVPLFYPPLSSELAFKNM